MTKPLLTRRRTLQALACGAAAGAPALLAAQTVVPEINLRASDGHAVLSDAATTAGKWRATYVDFWASWCTPCKLSFPWMNQMHERYAAKGLRIVAIGLDRKDADAQRFLRSVPRAHTDRTGPGGRDGRAAQGVGNAQLLPHQR